MRQTAARLIRHAAQSGPAAPLIPANHPTPARPSHPAAIHFASLQYRRCYQIGPAPLITLAKDEANANQYGK